MANSKNIKMIEHSGFPFFDIFRKPGCKKAILISAMIDLGIVVLLVEKFSIYTCVIVAECLLGLVLVF